MMLTFHEFIRRWPAAPGHGRALAFDSLSAREQSECWADLAEWCRVDLDVEHRYERVLQGYEDPPKRHQPSRRSTWATSTKPGAVLLSSDDPLKQIDPWVYVEALTGEEVPAKGWLSCPLPDHEDRTPSFQVLTSHWRCFGCNRGGGIIDLAAALYGITPRGRGYFELRDLIVDALEGSAPLRGGIHG